MSIARLHYIKNQGHQFIIDTMKKMGFSTYEQGMCAGLIAVTECAYLAGRKEAFDDLIDKIYNQADDLPLLVQDLLTRYTLAQLLLPVPDFNPHDLDENDILAYQAIKIFHFIGAYQDPGTLITDILQNQFITDEVDKLLSNEFLENSTKFTKFDHWPGIYTFGEFETYLNTILSNVKDTTPNFVVRLDAVSHRVSLYYDNAEGWFLLDPNFMPGFPLKDLSLNDIANKIFDAFRVKNDVLAVETIIRGISDDASQIFTVIDNIKNEENYRIAHEVTVEKINLQDDLGARLCHVAAQNNETETLVKIKLLDDMNPPMLFQAWTPLQLAAQEGFGDVIKLFSYFPEYESALADAVPFAILNNRYDLITDFNEINIDFAHANEDSVSYGFYAVVYNKPKMIEKLASLNAPLNLPRIDGMTPILYAAQLGFSGCVEKLGSLGVDLKQTTREGKNLADLAVENGHLNVLKILFKRGWVEPSIALKELAQKHGYEEMSHYVEKKQQKSNMLFQHKTTKKNEATNTPSAPNPKGGKLQS